MKASKAPSLYFDEPRLRMTVTGRFFVRAAGYVATLILAAIMIAFLISDLPGLRGLGLFLALFLIDKLVHWGEPVKALGEMTIFDNNISDFITPDAYAIVERAFDRGILGKSNFFLETFLQLLAFPETKEGMKRLDVPVEELEQKAENFIAEESQKAIADRGVFEKKVTQLLSAACAYALGERHRFIEPSDICMALFSVDDEMQDRLFSLFSITKEDARKALLFGYAHKESSRFFESPKLLGGFTFESHRRIEHKFMNRAWTARPTPILDRYSEDLTDLARVGGIGFMVGHADEIKRLVDALARPLNPNGLLVGEAGSGKSTILNHLAFLLSRDQVPNALFDKRLVVLHVTNLVASGSPQELQERLNKIIEEILLAGNIILCIPDIHNLLKTSGEAFINAADALMPIISSNQFPIIGTTYPREFKQQLEPRSDFVGSFEVIRVSEINETDAEEVLVYEAILLERQFKVVISFGALKLAARLAKQHFHQKLLPASAVELLKEAVGEAEERQDRFIGPQEIIAVAEEKTNVPIHEADKKEAEHLLHLEDTIHERFVDQEEAVKSVANALREYRSGLSRGKGPIASFLFVGPSGVGKTELAKILASIQYGSEESMTRFDMTEYQDRQSFYRLIGSPDGAISGALTEAVREKPYSLILLDEFEKAFPDILDLFLQVLDDGRLTDNLSRTIDFSNTIIIATSNAHSDIVNQALEKGESMQSIEEYLRKRLTDIFKPELINRFSKIVIFKDLAPADLEHIAQFGLAELAASLKDRAIELQFDPNVVAEIARLGYDPVSGARPLRRIIEEKIRAPLAEELLRRGNVRGITIRVSINGGKFIFT